jgi:hypothetical protein
MENSSKSQSDAILLPFEPLFHGNPVYLPKGDYLFVDPCYIKYLTCNTDYGRAFDHLPARVAVVTQQSGCLVVFAPTVAGDFTYHVRSGEKIVGSVSVDSGTLALVQLSLVSRKDWGCGVILALKRNTEVTFQRGTWKIGKYTVETDI